MRPLIVLLSVATLALGLSACGKSQEETSQTLAEQALEASTGADVDIETEDGVHRVTARIAQGEMVHSSGENVPLPKDFPADITLPADYQVVSVMTMGPATSIVMRSPEPAAEIFTQLRGGQAGRGWKETLSMQGAEGSMLGFDKDGRTVLFNLRDDLDGKTVVSLSLQSGS